MGDTSVGHKVCLEFETCLSDKNIYVHVFDAALYVDMYVLFKIYIFIYSINVWILLLLFISLLGTAKIKKKQQ